MPETNAKLLELLKEAVPGLSRVAVLWNPATPSHGPGLSAVEDRGRALGVRLQPVAVHSETEFDSAFAAIIENTSAGSGTFNSPIHCWRKALADLAMKHKLPTMFGPRCSGGRGLLSYGPDRADLFRGAPPTWT